MTLKRFIVRSFISFIDSPQYLNIIPTVESKFVFFFLQMYNLFTSNLH